MDSMSNVRMVPRSVSDLLTVESADLWAVLSQLAKSIHSFDSSPNWMAAYFIGLIDSVLIKTVLPFQRNA